jgi:UPF0716 protein FxsA
MRIVTLLFLLFPILELVVLIAVGRYLGVLPTIALLLMTSIFGALMLRVAGIATAWRAREKVARGEMPDQEVLEGLLIAVGGGLLLLPGFISDIMGLLCLLPATRRQMIKRLRLRAERQAAQRRAFAGDGAARSTVLEGEYERRD